tara:strand:- start:228 stop:443 length:216 start_codon:yes stop_codon:yes gene_type:complete
MHRFTADQLLEHYGSQGLIGCQKAEKAATVWESLNNSQQNWTVDHFNYQGWGLYLTAERFCEFLIAQGVKK